MAVAFSFLSPEDIKQLCQEEDLAYLGLFGSYARGEQREDSDMDFLYEFKPGLKKSYFDVAHVKQKLEAITARPVDVTSRIHIKPQLKSSILTDVITLYEER